MEFVVILLSVAVAGAAGYWVGRRFSTDTREKSRLEKEIAEKQAELDAFRNKVTSHFEKTADLFNQVSDSYQSLYDHIAKSSNQLCASPSFHSLPKSQNHSASISIDSPNPKTPSPLFDADKLYNAHDYRNHPELDEPESAPPVAAKDEKIVNIESAKEDKRQPALDYAIKEKGVINHNSLNNDQVKNS